MLYLQLNYFEKISILDLTQASYIYNLCANLRENLV